MNHQNRLAADHESILTIAEQDLRQLDGARLFITGGTGFIGTWLLESLVWAVNALQLDVKIDVLTRDPDSFRRREPHLGNEPIIQLLRGDVRTPFPVEERPDVIIHAATPASAAINLQNPALMVDTIIDGMRNVLSLAADCDRPRLLFTSSGAVYGQQPPSLSHVPEGFTGGPDPLKPGNAYHEGKRIAELLAGIHSAAGLADVVVARIYALLGPRLPLDIHFAAGNFIRDALAGGPIIVNGDGTPFRSYLYVSDLMVWLFGLLARGTSGSAYNVGSEEAINIASLARTVAEVVDPDVSVNIMGVPTPDQLAARYVPDCTLAHRELGLEQCVDIREGIRRTAAWSRGTT
ncbi:MAG: NAD-dependent epimerase/dehydratase family protein [Acidimicrobiales bacterium]|nr:NAD-dependent epimerase/dehydratase family protein [Acidimicrobiales bacterium]